MKSPLSPRASRLSVAVAVCASAWLTCAAHAAGPADYVNPLVGTDEHGHTYPGAQVPFGMVQLSPDTPKPGWDGCSGYHYSDNVIRGFSHTHLSGTGATNLGDVLVMPVVGNVNLNNYGYASPFSHSEEKASPGYYKVFLQKPKVTAELTATARAGFHKYTFPASENAHIVVDLNHGIGNDPVTASLKVENSTTISGVRTSNGWGGRRDAYFVMQFSKPFDSFEIEQDGTTAPAGSTEGKARSLKSFANFKTKDGEAILVKVGISGTSIEGARKNLNAEIRGWDFETVRAAANKIWNDALDDVTIESKDPHIRNTFYTNLYQSYLAPVLFNDVDGTYRGVDKQNHTGAGFQNYTTFSLWDTFRAEHPLLTILQPGRVPDMVSSMLAHYGQSKDHAMPVWPLWGNETWCMIGYHSAPVVVDAYQKGLRGYDAEAVYQALKATANSNLFALGDLPKYGYVVTGSGQKQSVSRTLEYAYDDWCVAQLAKALGHTEDAEFFLKRSAAYRQVFDTNTGFMRGRKADGTWRRPFNPAQLVWADYTEANAWQYNWTVMQDTPGLINITGGDTAFIAKMDQMFNEKSAVLADIPDITGLIGQYAHGNEPVHHVAYLYNYAGAPYKTQERVREIMTTFYNDSPSGQTGNNDCGQMSAWYVFSALGFYPVNPVGGVYVIGSPIVDRATIQLDKGHYKGKKFTVIAENNGPRNLYIQSARLNGKPLTKTWFTHDELAAGGELRLVMGPKPNPSWGQSPASRPPSGMPAGFQYQPLPAPSTNAPVQLALPIRVVAGSDDPVNGFIPDPNMMEGQTNSANVRVDTSTPGAAPAEVYKTERYGKDFTYSFPVPKDGKYNVRLHFAEIFNEGPGERIQNVQINGQPVLTNFDIATSGLAKAVVKDFQGITPDANGNITIRVTSAKHSPDQNAKISAIEITAS